MEYEAILQALIDRADVVCGASSALRCLREAAARWDAASASSRALTAAELSVLQTQDNFCENWESVRCIGHGGLEAVRQNRFEGAVLLRLNSKPQRLWRSRIRHAYIGAAVIENTALAERVWVEDGASLISVTEITGNPASRFCLGIALHPGSETGARRIWLWDGWNLEDCARMAALNHRDQEILAQRFADKIRGIQAGFLWVGSGARVESTGIVTDCFFGPGAVVHGAARVTRCVLDSRIDAPVYLGASVLAEETVLAPGSRMDSAAQAGQSLLLAGASLEHGGHLQDSVLGPNTHAAKGEISASLVGPFVGFHHQALLIGALWPEGRGNVAYGANVGSNHTGRKPDQEIRPGEGSFFGLGCSIKFPADFSAAPYSLFATGITAAPQRLAFPFSLIAAPASPLPPEAAGLNEILPGWMWSENLYALIRSAYKFADRNPAGVVVEIPPPPGSPLAGTFLTAGLFSLRIAQPVAKALATLRNAAARNSVFLCENDVDGLGQNFLRSKRLASAIAAYEEYLRVFISRALLWDGEPSRALPSEVAALASAWPDNKIPIPFDPDRLFSHIRRSMETSLRKDAQRGEKIFADYAEFHDRPETDAICLRLARDCDRLLPILKARADLFPS